jgi:hypothetical protein
MLRCDSTGLPEMAIATRAKRGLSRPQFLVRSASSATLVGLGGIARPYLGRAADRPRITCGLQSGDVSTDSAIVWARADRPARMQMECSTTESFAAIIRSSSVEALPDHDLTAKLLHATVTLKDVDNRSLWSIDIAPQPDARPGDMLAQHI